MYTVASAQLPEPPEGADRIFIAPNAVIVLDGASAFTSDAPKPAEYVDTLGEHLRSALAADPSADLSGLLAAAIAFTAHALQLWPGSSPSSTVAIARWTSTTVDLLVLGDNQISTPHGILRDDRLDRVATKQRAAYRDRLRHGHGYDSRHRELLSELQAAQARQRNQPGGYWIAEADPAAAGHALIRSHRTSATTRLILSTDGAYKPMQRLGIEVESGATSRDLRLLLRQCNEWEGSVDPDGQELPRSKRHDDKAIAVLTHQHPVSARTS